MQIGQIVFAEICKTIAMWRYTRLIEAGQATPAQTGQLAKDINTSEAQFVKAAADASKQQQQDDAMVAVLDRVIVGRGASRCGLCSLEVVGDATEEAPRSQAAAGTGGGMSSNAAHPFDSVSVVTGAVVGAVLLGGLYLFLKAQAVSPPAAAGEVVGSQQGDSNGGTAGEAVGNGTAAGGQVASTL